MFNQVTLKVPRFLPRNDFKGPVHFHAGGRGLIELLGQIKVQPRARHPRQGGLGDYHPKNVPSCRSSD